MRAIFNENDFSSKRKLKVQYSMLPNKYGGPNKRGDGKISF